MKKSEVPAEIRAQRVLNKSRVPEIARYIVENKDNYCFSAITASVDGDTEFIPAPGGGNRKIGTLIVPMEARFIVNDGQTSTGGTPVGVGRMSLNWHTKP